MFKDVVAYPFRNGGWAMILLGAIFAEIMDFASRAPIFGIVAAVFSAGYFAAFYFNIISSTITGHDACPEWPGVTNFMDDILLPLIRVIGTVLLTLLPFFICGFAINRESDAFLPAILGAIAFACAYFPMAILAVVAWGGLGGALPHRVMPAVFRCLPGYLVVVIVLVLVFAFNIAAREFAAQIPYFGWLISAALSLYLLMAKARLLGLLYLRHQEQLGWS